MNNLLQFRKPVTAPTIERRPVTPPKRLRHPAATHLTCEDGELRLVPDERSVELVTPTPMPPCGTPQVYAEAGVAILDLGDCTTERIALRLTPSTARAWGAALTEAGNQADDQQRE